VTVEIDDTLQAHTRSAAWPPYVRFELGDGVSLLPSLGRFDLIFADAPGGKTIGLESTIAALGNGGTLVVDDMDVSRHGDPDLRRDLTLVREALLTDDRLVCSELAFSSGVIVVVRRW
jgi:demethylmenaquinone methyltransferase/2-methoxy-6-polyprenyl-1,4-benzoquinol methylase